MTLFTADGDKAIAIALEKLFARMVRAFKLELHPEEVLRAMVRPEDMHTLHEAKMLGLQSGCYGEQVTLKFRGARIMISMSRLGLPLPKFLGEADFPILPEYPFYEKLTDYLTSVTRVAEQFAMAREVIQDFGVYCQKARQVRYFLPALPTLFHVGNAPKLAAQYVDPPRLRSVPSLPLGFADAVHDVNQLIARAVLLPDTSDRPVRILFDGLYYRAPWRTGVQPIARAYPNII